MQMQTGPCFPVEQRRMPDRRTRPTSFCSAAFRFRGRRAGFRRSAEGDRAYIDRPSCRIILLVLFVMLSSICDALLTLIHLDNGGSEANPVMALVLGQGTASFLRVKMSLTGVGAWVLAAHERFPLACKGLHAMAIVYGILLLLHAILFWT
jgi:hypothetical protein